MPIAIVSGALANKPYNGGASWTRLSWALGLRELGLDVAFVEQIAPEACIDDLGRPCPFERSANLKYFRRVLEQFGLSDMAALACEGGGPVHGLTPADLAGLARDADLLINITGHLTLPEVKDRVRRKVYIDLDPGYTQFWHAAGGRGPRLEGHDFYFTVGANIGRAGCSIPTGGLPWRPVRQPVVLGHWPVAAAAEPDRFTTVASWRGPYGSISFGGRTFGLKVHEFRKFLGLPGLAPQIFELALEIHPTDRDDREALERHGWRIVDPRRVASDPDEFRRYVQGSGAEFSAAQGIYVETESGWFSDRTVRYLASGKPALVQETGLSRSLPVGDGLITFRTLDEAVAGAEQIAVDYRRHCRAARAIAETYFDARRVLGALLDEVGIAP